jgi:uncharacterized protein
MAIALPLKGIRVQLAGAVPEKASPEQAQVILAFVQALASAIFREGGCLVHGSNPTMISPLKRAAEEAVRASGRTGALTLVRAHQHATSDDDVAEIALQRAFAAVHIIPPSPTDRAESLLSMREWMSERCDAIVAVGGNRYDTDKARAGVPLELEDALERGKAAFAFVAPGGAAAEYLQDSPGVYSRMRNGLSESESRQIAESTDINLVVTRIVQQLKRLPLVRESIPSSRMFRILALDGGGLRGAFTAAVLARWDDMLGSGGGNGLVKNFDMVAGTSTGAILAIGLALGMPPKEILKFYRDKGEAIFPKDRKIRHWLKSKHDSITLRDTLESVFGDRKLSASSCSRLVIPTVRAIHGQTEVIVTAHHRDRARHRDISAVDAALASSAAPTYFDDAQVVDSISTQSYLDGGIWANNPVLPAISEAVRYLNVPLDRIDVLSVGTMGNESDFSDLLGKGKTGWAARGVDLFFAAQEHAAVEIANSLLTPARHLRVNQQTPGEIPLDDVEAIDSMIARGDNLGTDTFSAVSSRFLDGFHSPDWRVNG